MYKQVDENGNVRGLYKWPNDLTKDPRGNNLIATEEEIQAFRSRREEKPKSPVEKLKQLLVSKSLITQKEADSL